MSNKRIFITKLTDELLLVEYAGPHPQAIDLLVQQLKSKGFDVIAAVTQ